MYSSTSADLFNNRLSIAAPNSRTTYPTINDSVVIHVNQTSSIVNAGIHSLTPNYWNAGSASDAKVKYQLAYFKFPGEDASQIGDGKLFLTF